MATHAGSEGKVFIGTDQVAEVKSWSIEVTSDTVDASIIGTQWRKNQATIKGWSGSFELSGMKPILMGKEHSP
jgi:hypothetical protein